MESNKLTILAICDNQNTLSALGDAIQNALPGSILLTASSAQRGIELTQGEDPEVILLDIDIAGMDGFTFCRNLKEDDSLRYIPVIFITEHIFGQEKHDKALDAGAEELLTVPFDNIELNSLLHAMVRVKSAYRKWRIEKEELTASTAECIRKLEVERTEHNRALKTLRESEVKYRTLVEHLPQSIFIKDRNSIFVSCNENFARDVRINASQISGKSDYDFYPIDLAEMYRADDQGVMRDNTLKDIEERNLINGEERYVHTIKVPYRDKKGEIIGIIGIYEDITERKRAEEAVSQSEAYIKAVIDNLPLGIAVNSIDPAVNFEYMNDNFFKIYRTTREALSDPDAFWESVYEDPEFREMMKKRVLDDIMSGDPERMCWEDIPITRKGAETTYLNASNTPVPGKPLMISTVWDVTERKRAEKDLEERELMLRRVLEALPVGVWIIDPNGTIILGNEAGKSIWSGAQFVGIEQYNEYKAWWADTGKPIEREEWAGARAVIKGETSLNEEIIIESFDGTQKTILNSAAPILDANGQITGAVVVNQDITERKRSEETLRYHEFLLREMGRIAKIGGWEFDPAAGNGTWTAEVARIHDLDPDDETNVARGLSFYQNESRVKIEKAIKEAIESGKPYDLELELVSAKGISKWVHTIGNPMIENGKVIRLRGSFQDITERKKAEEALREKDYLLSEAQRIAHIGSWSLDIASNKISWSQETYRIYGASPDTFDLSTESFLNLIHPGDQPAMLEWIRACSAGEAPDELLFRTILPDGSIRILKGNGDLSYTTDGSPIRMLGTVQDITEQKLEEEEKHKLEAKLLQAQKMESIARLAGGVAHDFNNMLGVILGHAEMAVEYVDPTLPLHGDLLEIQNAAERSAELTRQLLAFARKQTVSPKVLDLNETVKSMLKMLKRLIGEDIDLAWKPGENLWPVKIDPSQIDQILANLCVNARDAIDGVGKVTIETGTTTFDDVYCADHPEYIPGEYVMLAVSDNGCGMNKKTIDNLFEPFFTTKEMGKGTGLGLATVYGIVKQNNGFINVYSEPDQGTTFKIYLSRYGGKTEPVRMEGENEPALSGRETILLVEDEPAILNLTKKMLERQGYTVLASTTPGEAIRLASEHTGALHLLITDVIMPEMNGRNLAKNLLPLYPNIKRLFMSGYTANVIAHHGVLDEGVHFIQKPFSIKDLAASVRDALDSE